MSFKIFIQFSPETLSNTYVVYRDGSPGALMVDPRGFDVQAFDVLQEHGLRIDAVLLTHTDIHAGRAIRTMQSIYDFEIYGGSDSLENLTLNNIKSLTHFEAARFIIESHFLPGHFLDSLSFHIEDFLFPGDILSAGTVTNADDTYGRALLIQCIKESILTMPDHTIILPEYGPPSTVQIERETNVDLQDSPEIST